MAEQLIVVCDVCGAPADETVTFKVGARSLQKDLCSAHVSELVQGARTPKRGRRRAGAPSATGRTTARRRTSAKRGTAKRTTAKRGTAKRRTAKRGTAKRATRARREAPAEASANGSTAGS